ncbi:MAG: corrinoid protein [Spirochaetales bacterium]|nr:corrinoid protein [Spirochaetales bacterium]
MSKNEEQLLAELIAAIMDYGEERAEEITSRIIAEGIDPLQVMNQTIAEAARELGDKFESGDIFLPHLVMAGDVMARVSGLLESALEADTGGQIGARTIVIGTVQSDIHSIGKDIVAMLLKANGFKIVDLGVDVPSETFVRQAQAEKADIIALSSLLTTTMPFQREVIQLLHELGERNNYRVLIGGGPVTGGYADEIGSDGYGKDAVEAVEIAKRLTGIDRSASSGGSS